MPAAPTSKTAAAAAAQKHLMTNVNLLHDSLINTGHVQQCALLSRPSGTVLATSVGYSPQPEQLQPLLEAFGNPADARKSGKTFEGREFKVVRADKNSLYARDGKRGLVAVRTHSLVVLATYSDSMSAAVCIEACEKLGDYLRMKDK